jgi:hypothetical protein
MRQVAIVDLDGTVCDVSHREAVAELARAAKDPETRNSLWQEFHSQCVRDRPHADVVQLVRAWVAAGHGVIYITGRSVDFWTETLAWLHGEGLPATGTELFMRGVRDYRRATDYKRECYETILRTYPFREGLARIAFVLEDADRLVAMWRALGLTCLQPGRGGDT